MEHKYVWIITDEQTEFRLIEYAPAQLMPEQVTEKFPKNYWLKRVLIPRFTEEQIKDLSPRDAGFYKLGFEAAINSIK